MKKFCGNKSLVLLTVALCTSTSIAFSFGNLVSGMFSPYGREPFDVAMWAMTSLLGGFLGITVSGIILDKTSAYKRTIQVNIVACLIILSVLTAVTLTQAPYALFLLTGLFAGLFAFAVLPAVLGLGVEITFPLQPVLVNGVMFLCINIATSIISFGCTAILDVNPANFHEASEALIEER